MRVRRFRSRLGLTVLGMTGVALILTFALTGGPQRLADPPRVQAQAECGTYGDHLEEYPEAVVSLIPDLGDPGSPFGVELSNIIADEYADQPAEVLWDWEPELGGQLIGEGSVPRGATGGGMDAAVPEDAEPGEHMVTVCWWYSLNETWYWKDAMFGVPEPTPTLSPTATPGEELTPTATPTPGPEWTPIPSPTLSPTPTPTPKPTFQMLNCPKPGKWAISVWDGPDDTYPSDALSTCDEEGEGVDAAYALDADTQAWLRWFPGQPDFSNLATLKDKEGLIAHGKATLGPRGRIAFESYRDWNWEIYVMNADGSGQTNLTNNPGYDSEPAWSPDGAYIAFESDRDGNSEIYVVNADGTGEARLTNNSAYDRDLSWSPDSSKIAFESDRDGNSEIYVMNADGTGQTNLTNHSADDYDPAWSPDGSKIAFYSYRFDADQEIYVMKADGTAVIRLTNSFHEDRKPTWSPDGSKIAFISYRDNNYEIYVMNADGTGQTNLTKNGAGDSEPTWSPDGSQIAFVSNRDGNEEIYVMNADGSGQTNLTKNPASDLLPTWAPDGSKISFQSDRDGNWEVYALDAKSQTNLTNNPAPDQNPVWEP